VARPEDEGPLEQIAIPGELRLICLYRDNAFILPEEGTEVKAEDEVVVITHQKFLAKLKERWVAGKEKLQGPEADPAVNFKKSESPLNET
jgi:trk system potassium uptake protein TrkA